jgi:DNA-binding winged helix-turn-helix (wHTH) protein
MSDLTDVMALLRSGALLLDQALTRISEQQAGADWRDHTEEPESDGADGAEGIGQVSRGREEFAAVTAVRPLLVVYEDRPDWAYVADRPVPLRPAEYRLLARLMLTPRRVVRHDVLYDALWGGETFVEPGQVYSHVSRLRKKLAEAWPAEMCSPIRTVQRVGVVLEVHPSDIALIRSGEGELDLGPANPEV